MIEEWIQKLRRAEAYGHPVEEIEVRQTHISVVFLAGEFAYKLKKPVDFGFVDYSTLSRRRHFCEREVSLNRRLAPSVYLGVVPVCRDDSGSFTVDSKGAEVVEWAVKMRRLNPEDTLKKRLRREEVSRAQFERIGELLGRFHADAASRPEIDRGASFEVVAGNCRDNFEQAIWQVGDLVEEAVFRRARELTEQRLEELRPLIEARAAGGVARDTHGDLRLEHLYLGGEAIQVVDCVEFNDDFRFADPVSDVAFLTMDLGIRGFAREARWVWDAYFGDGGAGDEARQLIEFYEAYRSLVRAKVRGLQWADEGVEAAVREDAGQKARAHWLYGLNRLEGPGRGPALILVGGLPGVGKSTFCRRLVKGEGVHRHLDSDVVRKELAGLSPEASARAAVDEGIYSGEWTEKTYRELGKRAGELLRRGERVVVEASFISDSRRRALLAVGRRLGVPVQFVECVAPEQVVLTRLQARAEDPSDAGVAVYRAMRERWEQPSSEVQRIHRVEETG